MEQDGETAVQTAIKVSDFKNRLLRGVFFLGLKAAVIKTTLAFAHVSLLQSTKLMLQLQRQQVSTE